MPSSTVQPRLEYVQCLDALGLHRMAYWEWGDPHNPEVVVCVHGLSRQGRDFDVLARALCQRFRVVCPDVVGRGQSEWLTDPMGYQVPSYVADMVTLLARVHAKDLSWVGTSMGGLIGMVMASLHGCAIKKLVLNDVGPRIEPSAIERIGEYLGQPKRFGDIEEAADYMWAISPGFGPHSRSQWLDLCRPMLKAMPDGPGLTMHYDPAIALAFKGMTPEIAAAGEAQLWRAYDAIHAKTLLLRGAESDLLLPATAQAMTQRGPKARLHEFVGVGHAPMLVVDDQVQVVRDFLFGV